MRWAGPAGLEGVDLYKPLHGINCGAHSCVALWAAASDQRGGCRLPSCSTTLSEVLWLVCYLCVSDPVPP